MKFVYLTVKAADNRQALSLVKSVDDLENYVLRDFRVEEAPDWEGDLVLDDPTPAPQTYPDEAQVSREANLEEEEGPGVIALPDDLPYIGTLRKAQMTLDEIRSAVEDDSIRRVKGIGDVAVEKLQDYFDLGGEDEEEVVEPEPVEEEEEEERDPAIIPEDVKKEHVKRAGDATLQEIRSGLAQIGRNKGINAVKAVLKALEVESLQQLPEERYGEALIMVEEAAG